MAWGSRKKGNDWGYGGWAPYVPVAERRRKAEKKVAAMAKKGEKISPVTINGRAIATTFWGKAWCDNLESYMDFSNRLPRGRTYVRNGSVVDLKVAPGKVKALVSGSSLYTVEITIKPLETPRWQGVIKSCTGKIESLVELLQGKLSKGVMETVTSKDYGLFPEPKQISMKCSCPDSAIMCKHVAATLYGVGSRLDNEPELLFLLRQVDHLELITKASAPAKLDKTKAGQGKALHTSDLGAMFGIEIDAEAPSAKVTAGRGPARRSKTVEKPTPSPKKLKTIPLKAASTKKKAPRAKTEGVRPRRPLTKVKRKVR